MGYRDLLKEAARLKKEKQYEEAVITLRAAFESASKGEYIDIIERLRLPVYLCFADRDNEAWGELNNLASTFLDLDSQIAIRSMMARFLEDEGRLKDAVFFYAWCYVLTLQHDIDVIKSIHHQADLSSNDKQLRFEKLDGSIFELDFRKLNIDKTPFAYTEQGNPIFDVTHNHMLTSLNRKLDLNVIEMEFDDLCKKLNKPNLSSDIAAMIIGVIERSDDTGEWVSDMHYFFRQKLIE